MPPEKWIANASPLILLGKAKKIVLLGEIGKQVIIPEAVIYEISAKEDGKLILDFLEDDARFIIQENIEVPNYLLAWDLGAGETQVIALALELNPERVVLDDMEARKCAKTLIVDNSAMDSEGLILETGVLNEIMHRLVEAFNPEKVFLFGSYAYGEPTRDSDIDLLVVVKDSDQPSYRRTRKAYAALRGIAIPTDVIVMTRDEFHKKSNVRSSLVSQAIHQGKLLYGI